MCTMNPLVKSFAVPLSILLLLLSTSDPSAAGDANA